MGASGFTPHVIIGDLDRLIQHDLEYFERSGVDIIKFPVNKDETDLELAVEHVLNLGFEEIIILGATGEELIIFWGIYYFPIQNIRNITLAIFNKNSEIFYCKPTSQSKAQKEIWSA